jgi:hypothetical protein
MSKADHAHTTPARDKLSFVGPKGDGRSFWNVTETGNVTADNTRGAELAHELLAHLDPGGPLYLFPWIVRDMIAKGRFG